MADNPTDSKTARRTRTRQAQGRRILGRDGQDGRSMPADRGGDPHLPVPAVQHSLRLDGAHAAGRRLSVRREIRLRLQPLYLSRSAAGRSATPCMAAFSATSRSAATSSCSNSRSDNSTDFIKRLIGLPGDRIQMINGHALAERQAGPARCAWPIMSRTSTASEHHVPQYRETLPGGKSYLVLDRDPDGPRGQYRGLCRAARPLFHDGRQSRQFRRQPRRRWAMFRPRIWKARRCSASSPPMASAHIWEFWKWPFAIRYSRILTLID